MRRKFGRITAAAETLFRSGTSRRKIAWCIAAGVCLGIFPVLGATTLLCAIAALLMRLNMPLIQLINYAVYPLQLALLVPFYSAGSWLFGGQLPADAGRHLVETFQNGLWAGIWQVWDLTVSAVFVWMLVSPVVLLLLYGVSKPVVGKIEQGYRKARSRRDLSKQATGGTIL